MKTWPEHDAKARFAEFFEACLAEGPQLVTQRGAEAAVLVSAAEWQPLHAATKPSLKGLLLSNAARTEDLVPSRRNARQRRIVPLP
jgi:prevent-host-death family protein